MPRVTLSCPPAHSLNPLALLAPCLPLPSHPPTAVRVCDVPPLFQKPYILSGYRPAGLPWRWYLRSLLQVHNETLNVWSHLLAGVCVALRFGVFAVNRGGGLLGVRLSGPAEGLGLSLDLSSLPLVLYVLSSLTYLSCSAAAHLLHSHSSSAHFSLHFLGYVAFAVSQYGGAMALYFYSSAPAWRRSRVGEVFLPMAALLAWLSCASCCFAKLCYLRPYPLHRKLCQVVPIGLAYLLDISPVAHRLAAQSWWNNTALPLHSLQVALFLLAAFFSTCRIPECCFPGDCDIICHSHQLSHLLLSLCILAQQEAVFKDFLWLRASLVREHGEQRLLVAGLSFPLLVLLSSLTALAMRTRTHTHLRVRREDSLSN